MALYRQAGESAAATLTFGALKIDRRVIVTPARTIAIANISHVDVGPDALPNARLAWLVLAIASGVLAWGIVAPTNPYALKLLNPFTVGLTLAALGFVALALKPADRTIYLLIFSNDGALSRFKGGDLDALDEARRLLTDKINRGDETTSYNINFETGVIEPLSGEPPASGSTLFHGNESSHAIGGGPIGARPAAQLAQPGGAAALRSGAGDQSFTGQRRQPGHLGNGQGPNGGGQGGAEIQIDFAPLIPIIVEMHRFYARQPGAEHLEKRLEELELLMRSGAATQSQKARIRDLAREMAQILQAYPQVVKVFTDIGGMTGL